MPIDPISAALGVGSVVAGALQARARRGQLRRSASEQRSTINRAYELASERQATHERDVRQQGAESLASRGLLQGGAGAGNDLAAGERAETDQALDLERRDLSARRDAAMQGVDQGERQGKLDAIAGGINTASSLFQTGSMIRGAFGLDVVDPLRGKTPPQVTAPVVSYGQTNATFNLGGR